MKQQLQIVREPKNGNGPFAAIEDAIAAIRAGKMVIVLDDEDSENEGDLTIAAASSMQIVIIGLLILVVQRIFRLRLVV